MSFGNEREFIDHQQNEEKRRQVMKCPPFWMHWLDKEAKMDIEDVECLKEKCAWWDKDKDMCVKVSQVMELRFIRSLLREIRDKMPHERQFLK